MRIQCVVSYDGTKFYGWQKQPDKRSVQEVIECAINKITGEHNVIHSSGRTDANGKEQSIISYQKMFI